MCAERPKERGQTLVEAALVMLVFLLLLFGILEFGRAVWIYNELSHVSREAARFAISRGASAAHPATSADVRSAALAAAVGLNASSLTVNVTWLPDNKPGSAVKVVAQYPFLPVTGFIVPSRLTFTSTAQLTIAN